jgi:hypothetical protein
MGYVIRNELYKHRDTRTMNTDSHDVEGDSSDADASTTPLPLTFQHGYTHTHTHTTVWGKYVGDPCVCAVGPVCVYHAPLSLLLLLLLLRTLSWHHHNPQSIHLNARPIDGDAPVVAWVLDDTTVIIMTPTPMMATLYQPNGSRSRQGGRAKH